MVAQVLDEFEVTVLSSSSSDKLIIYIMVLLGTFSIYSMNNLMYIQLGFLKFLHDFLYENEYCEKTKI